VPSIIEYPIALQKLQQSGLVCNYFNGGAFGFARGVEVNVLGWIAADDPTIRPALRAHIRQIPHPAEANISRAALAAWQEDPSKFLGHPKLPGLQSSQALW